ncbi:hypothetical protein DL1_08700 [Thioclava dalianensis]|uniref:MarR family transcriptional regulator n=1 Tax=Thioclava dalianensis TaxID=1185766 RepID=A0A074TAN5_9RHOB|nr:hypothetical protein [Thioclava dalianensis]KEP68836.1 hypothetical protein DL1_08700 [Thioclava dalianensis]SFN49113.1 hypothetical protein SAMN05216224_10649 [Thioclava dalianensis]
MTARLKAKHMAIEFRIWAICNPIGWDITMKEVAQRLGISQRAVLHAARRKDWCSRFRAHQTDYIGKFVDHEIDAIDRMMGAA